MVELNSYNRKYKYSKCITEWPDTWIVDELYNGGLVMLNV